MFSKEKLKTREENIEYGKKFVEEIKQQTFREKREVVDFMEDQDKDMQDALKSALKKV